MIERRFDSERLYNSIVHYYIDKKSYSKERANSIAQRVVRREAGRRTCKNPECAHAMDDHIRNSETCLVPDCRCGRFAGMRRSVMP